MFFNDYRKYQSPNLELARIWNLKDLEEKSQLSKKTKIGRNLSVKNIFKVEAFYLMDKNIFFAQTSHESDSLECTARLFFYKSQLGFFLLALEQSLLSVNSFSDKFSPPIWFLSKFVKCCANLIRKQYFLHHDVGDVFSMLKLLSLPGYEPAILHFKSPRVSPSTGLSSAFQRLWLFWCQMEAGSKIEKKLIDFRC